MNVQFRPGDYCDVGVWDGDGLLHLTSEGHRVHCFLENVEVWQNTAPESLMYLRCAVYGDQPVTINKGHDSLTGDAWLMNDRFVRNLGPTFGVQPVAIDAHETYVIYARDRAHYKKIGLVEQYLPFPPGTPPNTAQGLLDVNPDGVLIFADVHRATVINGVTFTLPNTRGPVTVGQVDGGIAAAVGGKITLVIPGPECFEPHVAVSPGGRVAICARVGPPHQPPNRAAFVATTIQELSA